MSRRNANFIIRTVPQQLPDINTGCKIELADGPYRVTAIQSVRLAAGMIEIKGLCRSVAKDAVECRAEEAESDDRATGD